MQKNSMEKIKQKKSKLDAIPKKTIHELETEIWPAT
jgi:hypothetical protein